MDTMISYAQNGEDVMLKRVFGDKKTGFYIDKTYLRYDGRPFTPEEIATAVAKLAGRE